MAEMKDIAYRDGDIVIGANGDFVLSEPTEQHQRTLLVSKKGDIKEVLWAGIDILNAINDDEFQTTGQKEIRKQFELDGMSVASIAIDAEGNIDTDASYE